MDKDALLGVLKATVLTTIMTRLEARSIAGRMLQRSTANAIAKSVCDTFLDALPMGTFATEARFSLRSDAMADDALRALNATFEED